MSLKDLALAVSFSECSLIKPDVECKYSEMKSSDIEREIDTLQKRLGKRYMHQLIIATPEGNMQYFEQNDRAFEVMEEFADYIFINAEEIDKEFLSLNGTGIHKKYRRNHEIQRHRSQYRQQ